MEPKKKNEVADKGAELAKQIQIAAPNMRTLKLGVHGTAPLMQARFPEKAMHMMMAKHALGSKAKKGGAREARDFDADYHGAMHISTDGWVGVPASAFRAAMVSACRLCGFKMTLAKMAVFIEADGLDKVDGTPLVKIIGKPERCDMYARNATGVCDIRVRPMWREWSLSLRIRYDADVMSEDDVCNLVMRVGEQVGIGEGRPDSRQSCGLGYGLFRIDDRDSDKARKAG